MAGNDKRADGLDKAPGAHPVTEKNPKGGGRPRVNDRYVEEALEKGENPNPKGKYIRHRKMEDQLVEATTRTMPSRGMYSGETSIEEYKQAYLTVSQKPHRGRPWTFPTAEALQEEINAYFEYYLDHRIPISVAGLAFWLGVTTYTLKLWQKNQDTMPFYPVLEPALAFIQAMLEQGALEGRVTAIPWIFVSKNYFGMTDTVNMQVYSSEKLTAEDKQRIIDNLPKDIMGGIDDTD